MSNKKYRNQPSGDGEAPEPAPRQDAEGTGHRLEGDATKGEDTEGDAAREKLAKQIAELSEQARHVIEQLLHTTASAPIGNMQPLSDDEVSGILGDGVRFLHQFVLTTGRVLATVDTGQIRDIVGPELKLPERFRQAFENEGVHLDVGPASGNGESSDSAQPEQAPDTRPQKRPRGRKHPLLSLFNLAVQAMRLVDRITAKTNPHAHNLPTQAEKAKAASDRAFAQMLNSPMNIRV